jgi:hypothetical protein
MRIAKAMIAAVFGFIVGSSGAANAVSFMTAGMACAPIDSTAAADTITDFNGIGVNNTAAARIYHCPITGHPGSVLDLTAAGVYYNDVSTVSSVYCTPLACNTSGSCLSGGTRYSCTGAGGGCTSPTVSYTGDNSLLWTDPMSSSDRKTWFIQCSIPAKAVTAVSYVRSYWVTI